MSPTKTPKPQESASYGADDLKVLRGVDPIRKRPGMYVGGTDLRAFHHLLQEVINNSVDEHLAGHCTRVEVALEKGGWVSVADNGRGIPVDINKAEKKSGLELAVTELHAGGKFGGSGYKVSGGLHGIGLTAVNALSEEFEVIVERDGGRHKIACKRGIVQKPGVHQTGKSRNHGTTVRWKADPQIFKDEGLEYIYDRTQILERMRQLAFLNPGLYFVLRDERTDEWFEHDLCFEGGLGGMVRQIARGRKHVHPAPLTGSKDFGGHVAAHVAFQWVDEINEQTLAFANCIPNAEGGTHLTGFRTALTRELNAAGKQLGVFKSGDGNLTGDDVREGLIAVVSITMPSDDAQFEGQTKSKLNNTEAKAWVDQVASEVIKDTLARTPDVMKAILAKCIEAQDAREASRKAQQAVRKGVLNATTMPDKLADCSSRDARHTELFIVEGDSAGGNAKQGRQREFQAILPIRGKILNVEKVFSADRRRAAQIWQNEEIKSIINAVGWSADEGIGDRWSLERMRYGRIVLMADADDDGAHITTLLMTLFYRIFPKLVLDGRLFVARPPLYRIVHRGVSHWAHDDRDKERILAELKGKGEPKLSRFKGLGEMNAEQLWETTMDPARRTLQRVTVDDITRFDEVVRACMGKDAGERKNYLIAHVKDVEDVEFFI